VHASRFSGLLHVKTSCARVSQSILKTGGSITAGGARGIIAEIVLSSSRRRMDRFDGLRRTLLPLFCRFIVLCPMGILSFCLGL
jgi:hypothetical protein